MSGRKSNTKNPLLSGAFVNKKSKELEKGWLESQQEACENLAKQWADLALDAAKVDKSTKKGVSKSLLKRGGSVSKEGKVNMANALYDLGKDGEKNPEFEKAKGKKSDLKWNTWASKELEKLNKAAESGDKSATKKLAKIKEHQEKMMEKKARDSQKKSKSQKKGSDSDSSSSDSEVEKKTKKGAKTTKKTAKKTTKKSAKKSAKKEESDTGSDTEEEKKASESESSEDEKEVKSRKSNSKSKGSDVDSDESDSDSD